MKDQPIVMEGAYAKQYTDWMVKTGGFARDKTLRDEFAGLAMPMLAAEFYSRDQQLEDGTVSELISEVAYEFADSMLKERAK
jgi:hypothetical protein